MNIDEYNEKLQEFADKMSIVFFVVAVYKT